MRARLVATGRLPPSGPHEVPRFIGIRLSASWQVLVGAPPLAGLRTTLLNPAPSLSTGSSLADQNIPTFSQLLSLDLCQASGG